ncbi:PilW family protein [Herminiimonas sp. CN]|uniref:PilW family protein n=1 Tax=Herminiimonas sp. CN TaxID=1349818 RepID=UPI00047327A9|nr:PilW family protein [Herminiimonas sp. CN]
MTKAQTLHIRPAIQQGFTLVELMVSVTISLVLVLFVSSLYISSKGSYRINDDSARLQEDGRYAMGLIGRNLMQAGFGNALTRTTTDFVGVDVDGNPLQGLRGCDAGFVSPVAATPDFHCATAAGKPGLEVSYRVAELYDANTGAGADCNGQSVDETPPKPGIVSNRFFLYTKAGDSAPSLYCNGQGVGKVATVSQPVLSNVEDMVLTYGADTKGEFVTDKLNLNADGVNALPTANYKTKWNQVTSVQVCLLISSTNNVTPQAQTYVDCNGVSQTATDRKLRMAMTRVFTLRNNAASNLVD